MKQFKSILFFLSLAFSFQAQTLSIQGVVKNSDGTAAPDGDYEITFSLYTVETGGSNVWEETQNEIEVKGGTYSALLGGSVSFPAFTEAAYYLGISIEGGQELQPRSQLTAAPFALSLIGDDNIFPNTGNVGIGTNSPDKKLHVVASAGWIRAESTGTSTAVVDLKNSQGTWRLQGAHNRANNPLELEFNNGAEFEFFDDGGLSMDGALTSSKVTAQASNANTVSIELQNSTGTWALQGNHGGNRLEIEFNNGGEFEFYDGGNLIIDGTLMENSDRRLKKNIQPLQSALHSINQLNGYTYNWKGGDRSDGTQIGVIAQEVKTVLPELVSEDSEGMLSVNYTSLVPVLIEAVKEQQIQLDMLAAQNEKMDSQLGMVLWLFGGMISMMVLLVLGYIMKRNGLFVRSSRNKWQTAVGG